MSGACPVSGVRFPLLDTPELAWKGGVRTFHCYSWARANNSNGKYVHPPAQDVIRPIRVGWDPRNEGKRPKMRLHILQSCADVALNRKIVPMDGGPGDSHREDPHFGSCQAIWLEAREAESGSSPAHCTITSSPERPMPYPLRGQADGFGRRASYGIVPSSAPSRDQVRGRISGATV